MLNLRHWLIIPAAALICFGQDAVVGNDSLALRAEALEVTLPDSLPILIYSEEDHQGRWISVAFHDVSQSPDVRRPLITEDGAEGSFSLVFTGIGSASLQNPGQVQEHGHFPLQYQVQRLDPNTLRISGKTLPFDDIKSSYSFDASEYLMEFIYTDPHLMATQQHEPASRVKPGRAVSPTGLPESRETVFSTHARQLKVFFVDSLIIAGSGSVLVILLVLGLYLRRRRNRRGPNRDFGDIMDQKNGPDPGSQAQPVIKHEVFTEQMRENRIREIMVSNDLTYDEAALRFGFENTGQRDE